ncbi:ABC-type multidrug transport system fused ATPase/permease subunit [Bradyrhizobium huanghuaihaiense]|uniref:ABC-type multidrug transport system fused ATPase/permease subunit n=1 Tax=Bradyrhizobium huanghuaihaiense TaxID=990078 RepID=A0A562RSD7_9BRAD|nr:ABC transporter ATP-binding protein [Bradyrhizobium huanghuaihaiense]TWI71981.1 ABC-type multidrug transport system fused ATPase/permease subunit [Bradyrhizobium huanghuaihaiense]
MPQDGNPEDSSSSIRAFGRPILGPDHRVAACAVLATGLVGACLVVVSNSLIAELFATVRASSNEVSKSTLYACLALSIVVSAQAVQAMGYEQLSSKLAIGYRDAQEKALLLYMLRSGGVVRNRVGTSQAVSLLTVDLGRTMSGVVSILGVASGLLSLAAYIAWFLFQSIPVGVGMLLVVVFFYSVNIPLARRTARNDSIVMAAADKVRYFTEDHLMAAEEIYACHEERISARMSDHLIADRRIAYARFSQSLSWQVALNLVTPSIGIMLGFVTAMLLGTDGGSVATVVPVLLWALPNMLGHMIHVSSNIQSLSSALVSLNRLQSMFGLEALKAGRAESCRYSHAPRHASEPTRLLVNGFRAVRDGIAISAIDSFEATASKPTVLMGPRGSGKSTFMRALAGLEQPANGRVVVNGFDEMWGNLREQDWISYLPQHPSLFSGTVLANLCLDENAASTEQLLGDQITHLTGLYDLLVELGIRQGRAAETEALEMSHAMLGLQFDVGRYGSNLSGGERQLLALGRCLLRRRPITILDEPLNHLDLATRARILSFFTSSNINGILIVSTHTMDGLDLSGVNLQKLSPPHGERSRRYKVSCP